MKFNVAVEFISNIETKMFRIAKKTLQFLYREIDCGTQVQQVRHQFVDWRMLKDYRKRMCIKEHGKERLRINSLRKNRILPPELQALADEEIAALPKTSSIVMIVNRCAVTSRPRGVVHSYRLSRIMFRHLADYNKLAGVQRSMW